MISSQIQTQIVISKIRCLWRCIYLVISSTAFQTPWESQTFFTWIWNMWKWFCYLQLIVPGAVPWLPSAAAPKHCHTRSQPLSPFTVGLQFCSAWKTAGEKMAPTPPKAGPTGTTSHGTLVQLVPKNPHQGGAHVQSILPLLNCFLLTRI